MKLGFTGTREGMTDEQKFRLCWLIKDHLPCDFHHGDCIGADAEAHNAFDLLSRDYPVSKARLVIHPPDDSSSRACCEGDEYRHPKPYLERNRNIVDETDHLIAAPKGFKEELRSGTWATIRYALRQGKPVTIIYPDGRLEIKGVGNTDTVGIPA